MKRSEMTSIIMYYLTRFDIDPEVVHVEADELLKRIEKAGMLPPPTYIKGSPKVEGNKVDCIWDDE